MWIIVILLNFSLRVLLSICLIFSNFSLALLIKVLLLKQRVFAKIKSIRQRWGRRRGQKTGQFRWIFGVLMVMIIICYFWLDWLMLIVWMFLSFFVLFQPVSADSMKTFKLRNLMKNKSDKKLFICINAVFFASFCKNQQGFGRGEQEGILGVKCRSCILSTPFTLKNTDFFSWDKCIFFLFLHLDILKTYKEKKYTENVLTEIVQIVERIYLATLFHANSR